MRDEMRGHTVVRNSLRVCALATALSCCLFAGVALAQPSTALASEPSTVQPSRTSDFIRSRVARDIALQHAGLKKNQVTKLKVRLGSYDRKKVYLVKFFRKHVKYEYFIRAKNGKVLFYSAGRP